MKKGISYLVGLANARAKTIVICAVVGLTVASARADILTYDNATGAITWDFSTILIGLVGVIGLGIAAGATIYMIRRGWTLVKSFLRG